MATKKKTAKKVVARRNVSSKNTFTSHSHHVTLRSIIALLAVLLSFSVLMLFYTYKDSIIVSGSFGVFLSLSAFLLGLMLVLMYLVNPKK
ncbi:MAG: hypothetical protein KGJ07_02840 [Patescibacteria group bacterium]|nr:hypothetical protein [Patescibacteria group bacterium]MDE2588233.1 hypothetical protein [Patescibacteria group bacterium]